MASSPTPQFGFETTGAEIVGAYAEHVKGKTFLITGPSESSIGASVSLTLATASPKKLILAGRTLTKIQPVIDHLKANYPPIEVEYLPLDLGSLAAVRKSASQLNSTITKLDGLFNVAGVMGMKDFTTTSDSNESHFQTNYLAPFLFTNLIIDKIIAANGVAVNVASSGYAQQGVYFDDPNFSGGKTYNPWNAYGQSKTGQVLNAFSLTEKLKSKGVVAFAADPGLVLDSKLQTNSTVSDETFGLGLQMAADKFGITKEQAIAINKPKTMAQASAPILLGALSPEWRDLAPAFVKDCAPTPVLEHATGTENAERLWKLSEKMVGQNFDF
ncbi:MAG: hypothetical protein M1828_006141 [Chrysothrix sp. TS-e1954]|nr:MAG: hypothetical protein M1828_006141 [Chrysothrix sp. TS-e1954]